MSRFLRCLSLLLLLLGSWAIEGSSRAPLPLRSSEATPGSYSRPENYTDDSRGGDRPSHDLTSLRIFTKVILYVKDNYVDPRRVKPKEMMLAALEYVEKSVPDVIVDGNAESGRLNVQVNRKSKDFDISHVDSLWKMSFTIKDG